MIDSRPARHSFRNSGTFAGGRACLFFLTISLIFLQDIFASGDLPDHSKWDHILKTYVHNGLVDYKSLLQVRLELDDYLRQMESVPIETLGEASREERIAFWINLYNASVIRMVLDEYPLARFDQIPAAFEIRTIRVIDEFYNLAELRDQILRKGFKDERILTTLVSARMDSPKLLPEAFQGKLLEEQLNRAARQFVGDEVRNRIKPGEKKIFLSPLFQMFGSDFLLNYSSQGASSKFSEVETAVISFMLHHLEDSEKRLYLDHSRYQVAYLPEDPRLNEFSEDVKGKT